jgi:hypothetical protein
MKAAVLHEIGGIPRYEDFPDPVAGAAKGLNAQTWATCMGRS